MIPEPSPPTNELSALESLDRIVQASAGLTGKTFVDTVVCELGRILGMKWVFVAETGAKENQAQVVSLAVDGVGARPFHYFLRGTPCVVALEKGHCFLEADVSDAYPGDTRLRALRVKSYFSVAMELSGESPRGLLVAMHDKPMEATPWIRTLLGLFAAWLGNELTRTAAHDERMSSLSDGQRTVNSLNRLALAQSLHEGDVETFATEAATVLSDAVQARSISVWLRVAGTGDMEAIASWDSNGNPIRLGRRLRVGESYFSGRRRIRMVHADTRGELPRGLREFMVERSVTEHIEAAIRIHGEVEGLLALVPERPLEEMPGLGVNLMADVADLVARAETEARRTAEADRRRQLELEMVHSRKVEALGALAGGIAHDFNNILSAMMGNAELAQLDAPDDLQPLLDDVLNAGRHGRELVAQIFQYVRSESIRHAPVHLHQLLEAVSRTLEPLAGDTVIKVNSSASGDPVVRGDHAQLVQVVMNLCTNALQALDGGGTLQLEARRARIGETAAHPSLGRTVCSLIKVRDNGPGIPEEIRDRVFEPFFSTRKATGGNGLGLAIVERVVRAHGGLVSLESVEGSGTTFTIFLPLHVY